MFTEGDDMSNNETAPRWYGREPSKGCDNCRRLKIKCDEKRPVCSRCRTRGFSCRFRDLSVLVFRNETFRTACKVRKRLRTRQCELGVPASLSGPELFTQISLPVQQMAIQRFFYDFVLEKHQSLGESGSNGGYLSLLPGMYSHYQPDSHFALALSAVANANFWRRHRSLQARCNGLKDYSMTLQKLREELLHSSRFRVTADILVTTSLLAIYELIVSHDVSQRPCLVAHLHGAVAVLDKDHWDDQERQKFAGTFQGVIFQMIIDCLIMGMHPRLSMERCMYAMAPTRPLAALFALLYRAAGLCAAWKDHCSTDKNVNPREHKLEMVEWFRECQLLVEEIESWTRSKLEDGIIVSLDTQKHIAEPIRALFTTSGAPPTLLLYANIHQTYGWHLSKACQLTLLRTMIAAFESLGALELTTNTCLADHALIKAQTVSRTIQIVEDLLSSTFSTLTIDVPGKAESRTATDVQGFRGLELLWPLHAAGTCLISLGQHFPNGSAKLEWVRSLLRYIRDDLGIQTANYFLQSNDKVYYS